MAGPVVLFAVIGPVLIILAIVALFGFAALAVDIGRLYAERRRIQSAADAAALAAAVARAWLSITEPAKPLSTCCRMSWNR